MKNRTLVIGASTNRERYSNKAMRMLGEIEKPAVGIGSKSGKDHQVEIHDTLLNLDDIDTVTLYISPKYQDRYIDYIINTIKPNRIIFNPGTENSSFYKKAADAGIEVVEACTLVMIRTGQY